METYSYVEKKEHLKKRGIWRSQRTRKAPCNSVRLLMLMFPLPVVVSSLPTQDNRCYLASGGSAETFTVSESLPVGSVIGSLQVEGDPSRNGDITLSLADENSPVSIQPFSKTFILKTKLDKEGVEGLQNVQFEAICSKVRADDPSISIPVRVVVTDANDNTPRFVRTPYVINISEVTVVGTVVKEDIKAEDDDQPGPYSTVEYYVEPGPYSHLLNFESRLDGKLMLKAPLDYETLPRFSVTVRAHDQGDPPRSVMTRLTVNVVDADDQNPIFLVDKYTAILPNSPQPDLELVISPEPILAEDPDVGIGSPLRYTFNSDSEEYTYFNLDPVSAKVTIKRPIPHNFPLPVTLVVRASQLNEKDRFTLTTLTVRTDRPLPTDLKFLQTYYVTTVLESTPPGVVVLTVQTSKFVDTNIRYKLLDDVSEQFAIRSSGEVIVSKRLDYETQQFYSLQAMASDGTQVTDGDWNDKIDLQVKGPFSDFFSISNRGELRIRQVENLNSSVIHMIVVATDNGVPPRQSSVPLSVTFPEELLQGGTPEENQPNNSFILMVVFGVILGTLLIVIVTLTLYILKSKQHSEERSSAVRRSQYQSKVTRPSPARIQPANHNDDQNQPEQGADRHAIFIVDQPELKNVKEETVKNSKRSPQTEHVKKQKLHSPDDNFRENSQENKTDMIKQNQSNVNGYAQDLVTELQSKIHTIRWPNGSIPRRVKKLSWDDDDRSIGTELDPDVSVIPLKLSGTTDRSDMLAYF
ncbi:protocadherin gamma-B2-like isoform X2 [Tachypleus tridentatus]|uniref:protocadherin gamma-B2-like isoform X2 n=1 Tax=Tachypleus tridentatus TaxID=6853 RepID=UPI003FD49B41